MAVKISVSGLSGLMLASGRGRSLRVAHTETLEPYIVSVVFTVCLQSLTIQSPRPKQTISNIIAPPCSSTMFSLYLLLRERVV